MSEAMKARLALMAAILMVLSPLDPLPDALPVIGTFDDLIAMYFGMYRYIQYRQST